MLSQMITLMNYNLKNQINKNQKHNRITHVTGRAGLRMTLGGSPPGKLSHVDESNSLGPWNFLDMPCQVWQEDLSQKKKKLICKRI